MLSMLLCAEQRRGAAVGRAQLERAGAVGADAEDQFGQQDQRNRDARAGNS